MLANALFFGVPDAGHLGYNSFMIKSTQRRLAAIVSADVVGYSRLIGADEAGTLAALRAHRKELIDPMIDDHGGRIVKTMGDGLLLEFPSVVNATQCAVEIQHRMAGRNKAIDEARRLTFRIGINLGDIVIEGEDIHGDGVNVAARLQEASEPGGLTLSGVAHESLGNLVDTHFEDGGRQEFKNIVRPVQVWRWSPTTQALSEAVAEAPALPDKPSIAVLPFENMSRDPEQDHFADGIAEDVITALSRFGSLFVIARTSSFTYKDTATNVAQIARELGVRYIVEGSVRKAGNKVRITAQLVDATNGNHLWAERYDSHLSDVFELQDKITERIVVEVEPEISAHERELARRRPPENLDAWELVQQGLSHFYGTNISDQAEAIDYFEKAVSTDPEFALAHAQLSLALCVGVTSGYVEDHKNAITRARAAVEKAFSLDANEPMAHYARGRTHILAGETEPAIAEMQSAISINPNFAAAHYGLGYAHYYSAGHDELALPHFDDALRLSPRDPMRWATVMNKGSILRILGRHEEAISHCRQACQYLNSGYLAHMHLAAALAAADRIDEAKLAIEKAVSLNPELSVDYISGRFVNLHQSVTKGLVESLIKAGLPESLEVKPEDNVLPLPDKPSIAVLPFDNMSGDPDQEYFADGITEDIITALSRVGWLFVIARNSTFTYKGQAVDVTRIAGELGVRYIVEGSVRKAGNKVRITAQLIDGTNGNHVWAERYDRELDDIFALQDEISENIVGRIDTELRAKEIDLARSKPPASLDAWDLYQRGLWHLYKITKEDNEEAHASFRKATERDPSFSLAYAGIAMSCYVEVFHDFSDDTDEWINQGLAAGERAVTLDGAEYYNHAALGRVLMLSGEDARAIAELERSVALNPSYAHGYLGLGIGLTWQGRSAEAIRNVDMAMRLSPNDPVLWGMQISRAVASNKLGHYEEGEEWARKAVNARPDHFGGYSALVVALVEQDRMEEARATIATLMRVKPDFTVSVYRRVRWFANSEYLELNIVALRKAGLPEE
jgi:adenylate cyclase